MTCNIQTLPYPNIDLSPVVRRYSNSAASISIAPVLQELIYEIAVKYPKWKLVARDSSFPRDDVFVTEFAVWNDRDIELGKTTATGTVGIARRRSRTGDLEWAYQVYSHKIAAKRERGHSLKTNDIKRALAAVKENFSVPSLPEQLREARAAATQIAKGRATETLSAVQNARGKLVEVAWLHVLDNWEVFGESIADPQVKATWANFRNIELASDEAQGVLSEVGNGKHITVVIDKDKYVVKLLDIVHSLDQDELPDELKAKIGMLKLVELKQIVNGVGIRVGPASFIVFADDDFKLK